MADEETWAARGHMEGFRSGLESAAMMMCPRCGDWNMFDPATSRFGVDHPAWHHKRRSLFVCGPKWVRCIAGPIHMQISRLWPPTNGAVAQLAEQGAFTPQAEGSTPSGTTGQ